MSMLPNTWAVTRPDNMSSFRCWICLDSGNMTLRQLCAHFQSADHYSTARVRAELVCSCSFLCHSRCIRPLLQPCSTATPHVSQCHLL